MMKDMTFEQAIADQVQDLYNAENQLVKALPKMAEAANSITLRQAIEQHLEETRHQVNRLEQIADILQVKPGGKICKAMKGLIEEGDEPLKQGASAVTDAMIIAAAQRVEHYEIAAYGTLRTMAEFLGQSEVARLAQETLDEETNADKTLTNISESEILTAAAANGNGSRQKQGF